MNNIPREIYISGASDMQIAAAEREFNLRFPDQYREFLKQSNGCAGFVADSVYLSLWPVEELVSLNTGYAVDESAPGLLLFGSDGGGTAYAFDKRSANMPIVEVPFIAMDLSEVKLVADNFDGFIDALIRESVSI